VSDPSLVNTTCSGKPPSFHGVNTGSNPVGDAKPLNTLQRLKFWARYGDPPSNAKDDEFEGDEQAQKAMKGNVTAPFGRHASRHKIALEIGLCVATLCFFGSVQESVKRIVFRGFSTFVKSPDRSSSRCGNVGTAFCAGFQTPGAGVESVSRVRPFCPRKRHFPQRGPSFFKKMATACVFSPSSAMICASQKAA
jgi:hypothetical protein